MGKYFCTNMLCLFCVVVISAISLLFNEFGTVVAEPQTLQRFITFDGCICNNLQCQCCTGLDFANSYHHEVCVIIQAIPNEITLKGTLRVNQTDIYTGQLDPSLAPICLPPLPTVCFSINHVDIQKRQVCTKLTFLFFNLIKFPCISPQNGQLTLAVNMYM